MTRRTIIQAALADIASVLVFVALGRRSHDESGGIGATVAVAAPFLIGLIAGWAVARAWRQPASVRTGVVVWITTVVVGMALRHWAWDRGTATAFIIVATVFLGLFLVGWRAVVSARGRPAPVTPGS